MIALAKMRLKDFLLICATMVASLFVLLIFLNWAAVNREVLGFGENLPTYGYLLPTHEGKFFTIDIYARFEKQLLFAHGTGARSTLWRPTLEVTSSQRYRETAFDLNPFCWSEHSNNKNYSRARQAKRIIALLEQLGKRPIVEPHSFNAGQMAEAVIIRPEIVFGIIIVNGSIGLGGHKDRRLLPFPLRSKILRQYITAAKAS